MKSTKDLDFEINLLPVISILAVCISFLLLTTVWVRVGTFDVQQALGTGESIVENKKPEVWVTLTNSGSAQVAVKNMPSLDRRLQVNDIKNINQRVNIQNLSQTLERIKSQAPELGIGLIFPSPETPYEDLIAVMDELKKQQVTNLGIAPL